MNSHRTHEIIPCCGDQHATTVGDDRLQRTPQLPSSPERRSALRRVAERLPRPFRFLLVGGIGLAFDIALFTILVVCGVNTLLAGFLALVAATVLTWRLNRAFTFDRSGRSQREEAVRYAAVTAIAQGTSYAVFAGLAVTVLTPLPQAAIIVGAAVGALISYNGHRLFAFAPRKPASAQSSSSSSSLVRA
jgi:putative flippase GtrA